MFVFCNFKVISGIMPTRLVKVKSRENKEWHFTRVCLMRIKIFSNKLIPFDMSDDSLITEMACFDEQAYEYRPVKIASLRSENLISSKWSFEYLD